MDCLIYIIKFCDIRSVETLRKLTTKTRDNFETQLILSTLQESFNVSRIYGLRGTLQNPKTYNPISSYKEFLLEYNHRYRRRKHPESDPYFHLSKAIQNQDINIIKLIIQNMKYTCRYEYRTFYEAGITGNTNIFDILMFIVENDRMSHCLARFDCGSAYSGKLVGYRKKPDNYTEEEFGNILFEAMRGNNTKLVNNIRPFIKSVSLKNAATFYGIVASDDVNRFNKIKKKIDPFGSWRNVKSNTASFINDFGEDFSFEAESVHNKEITYIDELITCALYYKSEKILDILSKDHKISRYFSYFNPNLELGDIVLYWYDWINKRIPFRDNESPPECVIECNNDNLFNSAVELNNLAMVKRLEKYANRDKVLSSLSVMIGENRYKTVEWALNKFNYTPKEIRDNWIYEEIQDNYASYIVRSYLEKFDS